MKIFEINSYEDMVKAVALATEAAQLYYNSDETIMSDAEYDALVEAIEEKDETEFPGVEGVDALLNRVAAGTGAEGDVPHSAPMLSLKKVKTVEDLLRYQRKVEEYDTDIILELKLDGVALAARYVDGVLVQGLNRGDGASGKDVTARILNVVGLPAKLSAPVTGEVRGEVYMTTAQYENVSAARIAAARADFESKAANKGKVFDEKKYAFANSRNAVSGLVNRDDAPAYPYELSFAAYDLMFEDAPEGHKGLLSDSYSERVAAASMLGITAASSLISLESSSVLDKVEEIGRKRKGIDIPTDGCVLKPDSMLARERMGVGSRHPNHSVAWKYETEVGYTKVEDIEIAVGRTGRISLRARVQPVEVDGTVISYASLHNPSWLENKDVRIGSEVTVTRANDVIPQVVDIIAHPENVEPFQVPQVCPQCGQPWNKDSLLWRCESSECGVLGSIVYAASRDALDIDGLGTELATLLVETEKVKDMADLFFLTKEDLTTLPTGRVNSKGNSIYVGEKTAAKVMDEIQKAKDQAFARVLTALGLRATGRGISRRLAARYVTMDALLDATVESLAQTDKIGAKKAEVIFSELQRVRPVVEKLRAAGVNLGQKEQEEARKAAESGTSTAKVLEGMNVCITGSMKGSALDGKTRTEVQELIESFGGRAASSVSKTTHILVCEEGSTSSKMKKAVSLGTVQIMTPDEFAQMVGIS